MAKLDAALMSALASSIPGGGQILIEDTGHYIHADKPEALITPLMEMINEVRSKTGKVDLVFNNRNFLFRSK